MKYSLLFLLPLVLISGCIGLPDVFGRDVISVQTSSIENGVRDTIQVSDIATIPRSPLLPDQQLLLSFIVENRDTLKTARNVRVDLFNAPTIRNSQGTSCNLYAPGGGYVNVGDLQGSGTTLPSQPISGIVLLPGSSVQDPSLQRYCAPDQCGLQGCSILPGEQKPISFNLRSPSQDDIKGIKTDTKLDFKVTYDFDGSLNYIVPAVSTDEVVKRQRSGDKAELFTSKSYGSGPIQIDAELQGAPYMLSDTSKPVEAVVFFTINNKGSGNLVGSQIDGGNMEIVFPPDFHVEENEKFTCVNNVCTNNARSNSGEDLGAIPLYRDQSRSSIRFTVWLNQPLLEPFRSFQITSAVKYSYELRNSVSMVINPFQNV